MSGQQRIAESGVHGLLVRPDGPAPVGGVLAVPMVSGINAQGRLFATRLAEAGLVTFMWDPYPQIPEERLGQTELPRVADQPAAAGQQRCLEYLRESVGLQRVAAIGWCMGGRMVLGLAAREPRLAACVAYFPSLREPRPEHEADVIGVADTIMCPVQVFYGGQDHITSPQTFAALQTALQRRGQPTIVHVYPEAGHGFLAESRQAETANRVATHLAWPQTLAFLRAALLDDAAQAPPQPAAAQAGR